VHLYNSTSLLLVLHIVFVQNIFIYSTAVIVEITDTFNDYSGKVTYLADVDVTNMASLMPTHNTNQPPPVILPHNYVLFGL